MAAQDQRANQTMAKSDEAQRRELQRKARQAAELRANLAKRKEQMRQRTLNAGLPVGPEAADPEAAAVSPAGSGTPGQDEPD
jgi:hypothetical protein